MTDYLRSDEQNWHPGGIRSGAIGWLLAGIAIGAGAALLLLPSTRHELRRPLLPATVEPSIACAAAPSSFASMAPI